MSLKNTPSSTFTLCPTGLWSHAAGVSHEVDSTEVLWQDYSPLFQGFDDFVLVRWMARWGEWRRKSQDQYEHVFEQAAQKSEAQLSYFDNFPLVIWDDQDECLQVRPEDIQL